MKHWPLTTTTSKSNSAKQEDPVRYFSMLTPYVCNSLCICIMRRAHMTREREEGILSFERGPCLGTCYQLNSFFILFLLPGYSLAASAVAAECMPLRWIDELHGTREFANFFDPHDFFFFLFYLLFFLSLMVFFVRILV